jgi:hypothetical protein
LTAVWEKGSITLKTITKGNEMWVLLSPVLGKRVTFRAHTIKKKKERVKDLDDHEADEANGKEHVKCKPRIWMKK